MIFLFHDVIYIHVAVEDELEMQYIVGEMTRRVV